MTAKRIVVQKVSKVFGLDAQAGLALLRAGSGKEEILEKTRAVVGLHDVSFDVAEGEIPSSFMGLSGSGKSTMLRCINRLVEPTAGSIVVDGVEVTPSERQLLDSAAAKFGMVFQHFALFPNRTILDNVAYGLEIQKLERSAEPTGAAGDRGRRAQGLGEALPGPAFRRHAAAGGLARALAVDPDILLMDEAVQRPRPADPPRHAGRIARSCSGT